MNQTDALVHFLSLFPDSPEGRIVALTGRLPRGTDFFDYRVRACVTLCRKKLEELQLRRLKEENDAKARVVSG